MSAYPVDASQPMSGAPAGGDAVAEERARQLAGHLANLTGIDVSELPEGFDTPLPSLDIDSLVFIDFLVRTEEAHGFEWDEETPPEVFETLGSMARWMLEDPAVTGVQEEGSGCS